MYHWTVFREDLGMTYEGLHEAQEAAEKCKVALINQAEIERDEAKASPDSFLPWMFEARIKNWEKARVIHLEEDQKYDPWGNILGPAVHGVNDGLHGSQLRSKYR